MMSTTSNTNSSGGGRSKFPFTANQWQELEHQALIYKYMTAGIPVPAELLFTIKRSLDSSFSSKFLSYPHHSPLGWNPYEMGYGKKIDPEPGRCRRTDGKKWRCSKEAFTDSKYCERHMHRGKNRSRKPVETLINSSSSSSSSTSNSTSFSNNKNPSSSSSSSSSSTSLYALSSDPSYPSLYPHKEFSRDRYFQGMKEEVVVGEHAFFTENSNMRGFSGSSIDESWNLEHSKQSNNGGYPNYSKNHQQQQQGERQCYIWGRDFNSDLSIKVDLQEERENNEKTHHFFDEWAPPMKDGGGNGGGRGGSGGGWQDSSPSTTTQLSISIPSSAAASASSQHDFFLSNSRSHLHEG